MSRDDIIRMAREAGWRGIYVKPLFSIALQEDDFLRFAALVAAAEREACAKVCDRMEKESDGVECCKWPTPADCAAAIRARGNT